MRGAPAVNVVWRQPWVCGYSEGRIATATVRARRPLLDDTPTPRGLTVGRRLARNLGVRIARPTQ